MRLFRHIVLPLLALSLGAARASGEEERSVVALTVTRSDYGGGRIYLPVRFGNVMGPMRLDTGATTTRIRLAPWNADLPSRGRSVSAGATGKTTACEDVEARNVELKAAQGNNIGRAKYDVSRCDAGDGDDLLGLDFFKNARFSLAIERGEMIFSNEPLAADRAKPFRPLGPDGRLVGIDVRVGDATAVGLFDTGAEISAVDKRFVDKHKKLFTLVKKKGKASEAGGRRFSSNIYKIKELDLGEGRILRDVYAFVYDFGAVREALGGRTPFILGFNVVSAFDWQLDFKSPDAPKWDARPK